MSIFRKKTRVEKETKNTWKLMNRIRKFTGK